MYFNGAPACHPLKCEGTQRASSPLMEPNQWNCREGKWGQKNLQKCFFVFQEECNKSGSDADGDEDGDEGDVSDNVSTTVAEPSGQFQ